MCYKVLVVIVTYQKGVTAFIVAGTGAISITQPVDYEMQKVYYLAIVVSDNNVPPFSRTGTLTISITDICFPPQFLSTPYAVNIRQNVTASVVFLTPSVYIEENDIPVYTITDISPWSPTNMNLFFIGLNSKCAHLRMCI
jgi:hypothetical protein